ncbi:hypothetical protein C8P65_10495 [Capnocytophaga leadbetteri]|uniref:Uncharacterized protein n=1 Tax=Capnocytophaga leadbetteri TaxID=327575 RepID=A0A2T5XVL8_9FLAO|nr:hypothetical protein [Capnocytophaga leadbetteri]PTX07404.1 hypothetical protein C8P65_10495 [Capnocytophaga leadbetteri]
MDSFYIICFALFFLPTIVFLYFTVVRKNAFEERLALFSPTRHLSQKREAYRQQVCKYSKYTKIILLVIFYLPLCVFIAILLKEEYEGIGILNILSIYDDDIFVYVPILLLNYLLFYVIKRNEKAQHMLLEQMSDADFELLLKVKDSLLFTTKYNPPFVLCNDKLYIFIFFVIKEIDPTQITDLDWSYRRNGIYVEFKAPKKIIFTLPKKVLPHFLQVIEKYTNQKFYY